MLNFFTILLFLFTIFMVYAVITSKKNRNMAAARYHEILSNLDSRMEDEAKTRGLEITGTHFSVTDEKEGYLLGIDAANRQCILCGKEMVRTFSFEDLSDCQVLTTDDDDPKYYQSIGVRLEFTQEEPVTLVLATKRGKRKGFIGSELLRSAQEFQLFLISETRKQST